MCSFSYLTEFYFIMISIMAVVTNMGFLPSDSFMSCLSSLLRYSTKEFQALQLIVLSAVGAVD